MSNSKTVKFLNNQPYLISYSVRIPSLLKIVLENASQLTTKTTFFVLFFERGSVCERTIKKTRPRKTVRQNLDYTLFNFALFWILVLCQGKHYVRNFLELSKRISKLLKKRLSNNMHTFPLVLVSENNVSIFVRNQRLKLWIDWICTLRCCLFASRLRRNSTDILTRHRQ